MLNDLYVIGAPTRPAQNVIWSREVVSVVELPKGKRQAKSESSLRGYVKPFTSASTVVVESF